MIVTCTILVKDTPPMREFLGTHSAMEPPKPRVATKEFIETCRELWRELHDKKQDADPVWFADWVKRVPNFGCRCRNWLREYLKTNPPRYNDFYEWSVECHDAVNLKRGVALWDRVS